jgi:hypothetical protein
MKNKSSNGNGKGLTAAQKKLPPFLQNKIVKANKNKKNNKKGT